MKIPTTKDIGIEPKQKRKWHHKKVWTPADDEVLFADYVVHGAAYCAKRLDRTQHGCQIRARLLGIKARNSKKRQAAMSVAVYQLRPQNKPIETANRPHLAAGEWKAEKVGPSSVFDLAKEAA